MAKWEIDGWGWIDGRKQWWKGEFKGQARWFSNSTDDVISMAFPQWHKGKCSHESRVKQNGRRVKQDSLPVLKKGYFLATLINYGVTYSDYLCTSQCYSGVAANDVMALFLLWHWVYQPIY